MRNLIQLCQTQIYIIDNVIGQYQRNMYMYLAYCEFFFYILREGIIEHGQ